HLSMIWVAVMAIAVAGCGSSSSTTNNQPKPTGLKKRVWISNVQSNTLNLLDAQKDTFTTKNIGVPSATKLVTAGRTTIATDSVASQLTIIDNATEDVTVNAAIGDVPFDIAIPPDGKTAWTAQRDFGFVQSVTTSTGVAQPVIRIPNARTLALSPKGTKLIVF